MCHIHRSHASPRHDTPATSDPLTGEIRIPLAIYHVDEHQSSVPLVLSRVEAELLHAALSRLMSPGTRQVTSR